MQRSRGVPTMQSQGCRGVPMHTLLQSTALGAQATEHGHPSVTQTRAKLLGNGAEAVGMAMVVVRGAHRWSMAAMSTKGTQRIPKLCCRCLSSRLLHPPGLLCVLAEC